MKNTLRRYQKYPKNNFDLLFINIGYDIHEFGAIEKVISFQEYLQYKQIFSHKLTVMDIAPPFNDRNWYEENFSDIKAYSLNAKCEKNDVYRLTITADSGNEYRCNISNEMYRVLRNYKKLLFIEYNDSIIDFLPCPGGDDIEEFNRYNYEKNQTGEQMRFLRILYSQIEEDIDTDWPRYSGNIEDLLSNLYEYQNRKYEFASDTSISLLNDTEINEFIQDKTSIMEAGIMISFEATLKKRFFKNYIKIKNPDIKDIEYSFPVTDVFLNVFKGVHSFVFCIIDFEVKEVIPIYS